MSRNCATLQVLTPKLTIDGIRIRHRRSKSLDRECALCHEVSVVLFNVLFSVPQVDISNDVIAAMDARYKGGAGGATGAAPQPQR